MGNVIVYVKEHIHKQLYKDALKVGRTCSSLIADMVEDHYAVQKKKKR